MSMVLPLGSCSSSESPCPTSIKCILSVPALVVTGAWAASSACGAELSGVVVGVSCVDSSAAGAEVFASSCVELPAESELPFATNGAKNRQQPRMTQGMAARTLRVSGVIFIPRCTAGASGCAAAYLRQMKRIRYHSPTPAKTATASQIARAITAMTMSARKRSAQPSVSRKPDVDSFDMGRGPLRGNDCLLKRLCALSPILRVGRRRVELGCLRYNASSIF